MIVIAAGFISLSPLSVVSTLVMCESSQCLGKNIVRRTGHRELQESMDRCICRHDITEIMLKTALNNIHGVQYIDKINP